MEPLTIQIISGVIVAAVSFGFGYFLFRSQTNEQIRLEIYRRRLNCYEEIVSFLDDLDFFAHRDFKKKYSKEEFEKEKDFYVQKAFKLDYKTSLYIPTRIYNSIKFIHDEINFLPESLGDLEEVNEKIRHLIEKDIGENLPNWRIDFIRKDKAGDDFDKHFEGKYEL